MTAIDTDGGLKRAACLIASQLPENEDEAMRVLDYAKGIVRHLKSDRIPSSSAVIPFSPSLLKGRAVAPEGGPEARTYSPGKANPV